MPVIFCSFQFNYDMLTLIFQEAHWGGVEIHRGGRKSPSVPQDRSNHPQTCCGPTRWHCATAVERWDRLCVCVCLNSKASLFLMHLTPWFHRWPLCKIVRLISPFFGWLLTFFPPPHDFIPRERLEAERRACMTLLTFYDYVYFTIFPKIFVPLP